MEFRCPNKRLDERICNRLCTPRSKTGDYICPVCGVVTREEEGENE